MSYIQDKGIKSFELGEDLSTVDEIVNIINNKVYSLTDAKLVNDLRFHASTAFEAGQTDDVAAVKLTSTTAFVSYRDVADSNKVKGVILTVNTDKTVTAGTEYTIEADAQCDYTTVDLVEDGKVIVCYMYDATSAQDGAGRLVTYSGTTITGRGSRLAYETTGSGPSVKVLDTSRAVVVFRGASSVGSAEILSISGTTLTGNSSANFDSNTCSNMRVDLYDSNTAIVVYNRVGTGGRCAVLTFSGTTVTPSTSYPFKTDTTDVSYIDVCVLNERFAFAVYKRNLGGGNGIIIKRDNTSVLTEYDHVDVYDGGTTIEYPSCRRVADNLILLSFRGVDSKMFARFIRFSLEDGLETYEQVDIVNGTRPAVVILDQETSLIGYNVPSSSGYGIALSHDYEMIPKQGTQYGKLLQTGTSGQSKNVKVYGIYGI